MRVRQLLSAIGLASTLVIACGDDEKGGSTQNDAGSAGEAGDRSGGGGSRNRAGRPNRGGEPGIAGQPDLGGQPGAGGSGGEDCTQFVDFVHQVFDATEEDYLPSAIPDLCPAGPNSDLDAPATAFDDLL